MILLGLNFVNTFAASDSGGWGGGGSTDECDKRIDPTCGTTLADSVQNIIGYLTTFLYIVAVIYGLWGGFQILTASGDEEKVKKGKKILINATMGIVIIFIAGSIVRFVLDALTNFGGGN